MQARADERADALRLASSAEARADEAAEAVRFGSYAQARGSERAAECGSRSGEPAGAATAQTLEVVRAAAVAAERLFESRRYLSNSSSKPDSRRLSGGPGSAAKADGSAPSTPQSRRASANYQPDSSGKIAFEKQRQPLKNRVVAD
jgi:hypothetical protein